MLEVLLSLNRVADILMMFGVDEALQTIPLGEAKHRPNTMLPCSARQVAGYANIKCAIRAVRYDVNPSSQHGMIVRPEKPERNRGRDGRVRLGHDGGRV